MAYDEAVAARLRGELKTWRGVAEKKMFGGIAFLWRGKMICGVLKRDLVLRLGEQGAKAALTRKHVRPMDFTGKPLNTMVYVAPEGYTGEKLKSWLRQAHDFVRSEPAKSRKKRSGAGKAR